MSRLSISLLAALLLAAGNLLAAGCPESWQVRSWQPPALLWVGLPAEIPVEVTNRSEQVWSEEQSDHLSYHWRHLDGKALVWDGDRTQLPGPLHPGQTVRVALRVRPPTRPGRYLLELAMVREHVCWYTPPAGAAPMAMVRVWPLEPFMAVGFFLASLGLVLFARWQRRPVFLLLGPGLWLVVASWVAAKLFAIRADCEGLRAFDPFLLSTACAVSWPWVLLPRRLRGPGMAALGLLVTLVAFADTLYLRFFGSIVPLAAWRGAGQLGQVWDSVRFLMAPADGWFALVAAACVAMVFWPAGSEGKKSAGRWWAWLLAGILLAAALPAYVLVRRLVTGTVGQQVFSLQHRARELGLWGAHLLDVGHTVRDWLRPQLDEDRKRQVTGFFAQRAEQARRLAPPQQGVAKGYNLVLIQVESLQQFVVGLTVNGQEVTPFLNQLARRGLYFPWVFDQTNQGRSSDGEFIALNSQHALADGAVVFRAAGNRFLALPEVLRRQGYHTLSAHPFERGFWNRALLHPGYGFEQMLFKRELGPGEVIGWGLADGVFFSKMLPILERAPQPFFAFLITLGLHHPFDRFPAARKVLQLPDLGDSALANYLQAMRYFDASLESFFQGLEQRGLTQRTVVALYGDHEAGFPLKAPLANLLGVSWSPGRLVWLRRVPFFVWVPGSGLEGEVPEPGGHVDIAPTLLALLGIPRPTSFVGSALVPGRGAAVPLADGSAVDSQRIWNEPHGRCEDRLSLAAQPAEACAPLRAAAARELSASRLVVLHDLVPLLSP